MRYLMRQKLFSLGGSFTIRNESDEDVFLVEGKAFSLGHQLSFQNTQGKELAFIRQKLMAWGPTYEIFSGNELRAVVKKALFTFFHCRFSVDVPGPDDLEATGGFTNHEYAFERGGQVVATVSKQWFAWTDTYGVDIADGEDDVLILASTVVIDLACHKSND